MRDSVAKGIAKHLQPHDVIARTAWTSKECTNIECFVGVIFCKLQWGNHLGRGGGLRLRLEIGGGDEISLLTSLGDSLGTMGHMSMGGTRLDLNMETPHDLNLTLHAHSTGPFMDHTVEKGEGQISRVTANGLWLPRDLAGTYHVATKGDLQTQATELVTHRS